MSRSRWPRSAVVAVFVLVITGHARAWITTVNGDAPAEDFGRAVVLDAAGSSIAVGTVNELGSGATVTVVKRTAGGQELWRQRLSGTMLVNGEGGAEAAGVAVDALGDVVVIGTVPNVGSGADVLVAKLAGVTGAEAWRAMLDGSAHGNDRAVQVVVDPAGDVLVAATLRHETTATDAVFVKLAGTAGSVVWRREFNGTAGVSDRAAGVAVDSIGRIAVGATFDDVGTGQDFAVARLAAATGAPLWGPLLIDGGTSDSMEAVAMDGSGSVLVAGTLRGAGGNNDFAVARITPAGTLVWTRRLAGTADAGDTAYAVAADGSGDVVAAGRLQNLASGLDFALVKLRAADGATLWTRTLDGAAHGHDRANAVAVDAAGEILAAGSVTGDGSGPDFVVLRYAADGTLRWMRVLSSAPLDREDAARSVATGPGGDVVVGVLATATAAHDFHTMRLEPASGATAWEASLHGSGYDSVDHGDAVAVDRGGNVIAAGTTDDLDSSMDVAVVSLDGATGAVRWSRRLTGTVANGFDHATAVAADAAGDAIVAGDWRNTGTGKDLAVAKLRGADGSEIWRASASGDEEPFSADGATAVAVDEAGNVAVAGQVARPAGGGSFFVRGLDGATGAERWTTVPEARLHGGPSDVASAVAMDAARDVVAVGKLDAGGSRGPDFAVVKLDGATGAERWRALYDGMPSSDAAQAVAIDAAGDVVAAGTIGLEHSEHEALVVKLAGADGAERWQRRVSAGGAENRADARAVRVDAAGDVYVACTLRPEESVQFAVLVKLSGVDGTVLWQQGVTDASTGVRIVAASLALDAGGDPLLFVEARTPGPGLPPQLWLLRLAASSGAELWRRTIVSPAAGIALAAAMALDAGGNPVVVGTVDGAGTSGDLLVGKVSGVSGLDAFCGDGTRGADERCDDGNSAGGDCCSPTCVPQEVAGTCGAPCETAADCDDTDACSVDACDDTSHCTHDQVIGDAAVTCALEEPLEHPACARVPRRMQRMFSRAGRLVTRAVAAERPARQARAYARASRLLAGLGRLVDRAEHARRRSRRLTPECAAALRTRVGNARSRIEAVR